MNGRRVLEFGLLLAAGYGLAVGGLFLMQDRMIFPRAATPPPGRELPATAERWSLPAEGGVTLHGVHLPGAEEAPADVVGFSGNAWNAQDFALFLRDCLPEAAITVFHYRGYAPSGGAPSEAALAADARRVVAEVSRRRPERPVVLVGVSLGSGVAAQAIDAPGVAGAVLVAAFDSLKAVARERYRWAPVGLLLRHQFDSAAKLAGTDRPVAVLSAARDELFPPARTAALVAGVRRLAHRHVFADADHNSIVDEPSFAEILAKALAAVLDAHRQAVPPRAP